MRSLKWLAATGALLLAGAAQANSCGTPTVEAPRQGREMVSGVDGTVWPPNHKFRTMKLSGSYNDNEKACDINITGVKQDEPTDAVGSGGPKHCPDAQNINNTSTTSSSVDLRGERAGTNGEDESAGGMGDGRYYHVQYNLHDPDDPANDKSGEALLLVPHDQGKAHFGTWVDEGPLFDSTSCTGL